MNIKEVRQKYPQYEDMSDVQLADALHGKFYADMPKEEFYKRIGLVSETTQAAVPTAEPDSGGIGGVLAEGGKGLVRGASNVGMMIGEGVAGLVPGVGPLLKKGVQALAAPALELVRPDPQNEFERFAGTTGELAGGAAAAGGAGTVGRAISQTALPAISGAVGEQLGGDVGKLVGGVGVPLTVGSALGAVKNRIAAGAAPTLETFKAAGATPSVGQVTGSVFARGLENLASRFPGGAGVIKKFVEQQQSSFGAKARTGVSAEAAGRVIEKGITGKGGFIERSKAAWQGLDDALAARIRPGTMFAPANTMQALDDLTRPVTGAEKTTGALVNPKIAEMKVNLTADVQANNGALPYEAIRALRTRVGSMLDDALVSGVPGGELKKLYGALSKDLEVAATQAGAGQQFARQNAFYRSRMDRIESVLERVIGKSSQPEEIFKRLVPTDPDQAGKVRAVMRSLDPSQRQIVSEAVVNRLGRATPGKQDDLGEVFSSETFLSNWNKMSVAAKAQLFPNHSMRQNVETIAKAASQIRSGSGIYANPSGTAGSFAAYSVYGSPLLAVASGGVAPVVAAGGAIGTAYVGAKMLTNPKVVEWLARPVNPMKSGAAAAHLARLAVIYNQVDDGTRQELDQFISSTQQQAQ